MKWLVQQMAKVFYEVDWTGFNILGLIAALRRHRISKMFSKGLNLDSHSF